MLLVRLLTIPLFAVVNHIRGGGGLLGTWFAKLFDRIPLSGDLIAVPFVFLMSWASPPAFTWYALSPPIAASIFTICWLCWSTPAWGFLQGLGRGPGPIGVRQPSWYEALFIKYSFGSPHLAYGYRTTLFLIPMAACFGWYWLALGILQVGLYELGWRVRQPGIAVGELLTGAAWGAFLVGASYL